MTVGRGYIYLSLLFSAYQFKHKTMLQFVCRYCPVPSTFAILVVNCFYTEKLTINNLVLLSLSRL